MVATFFAGCGVDVHDQNPGAFCGQPPRRGSADTQGPARYDRDAI
jgi:hypothetical protein